LIDTIYQVFSTFCKLFTFHIVMYLQGGSKWWYCKIPKGANWIVLGFAGHRI